MAFTNAPVNSTYDTQKIPAVYDMDVRGADIYSLMTNLVPRKVNGGDLVADTRYCISGNWVSANSGSNQWVRGVHVWEKSIGTLYYFVVWSDGTNSKVSTSTDGTTWTVVTTLGNNATTPVRFTEFIDGSNTKFLILVDGIEGWVFNGSGSGTKITDLNFPTPHIPFPVFIDGYLFLAKAGTGDIYNSNLNTPSTWTAGSFISAEMYPDDLQALLKINNYLVAVGTQSCEYFYDAANPTASPMQRIESLTKGFGTSFPNTIAYSEDTAIFLANNNDGETVLKELSGIKARDIPCPWIVLLNSWINQGSITNTAQIVGFFIRQYGDLYYCIGGPGFGSYTFAYSINENMWVNLNTPAHSSRTSGGFPVTYTAQATSKNAVTYVVGECNNSGANVYFGTLNPLSLWANSTGNSLYAVDMFGGSTSTQFPLQSSIQTPLLNFGTLNQKTMSRFGINFQSPDYTASETFQITIYDNGVLSNPVVRSLAKSFSFPFITQLGAFRQRQLVIQANTNYPVRFYNFEFDINKGMR